ncbi:MAG: type III PLP-dependent enzyme [Anaerolineaceae bacterium]|nr:type III PLP-dependent enzyme [Anaerolineaceae bacterium]
MSSSTDCLQRNHNFARIPVEEETPFIVLYTEKLKDNCRRFRHAFPGAKIYFAVKANNHPAVIQILRDENINFDVASWGEIYLLLQQGICQERIAFNAPSKIPREIKKAFLAGVDTFTFDSTMELEKLAALAPGSKFLVRIAVDNLGSFYPLDQKFGMGLEEALNSFRYAKELGLIPYGVTFHVGSQNSDPQAWVRAIEKVAALREGLASEGIELKVVDIGGGYPVCYREKVPEIEEIAAQVNSAVETLLGGDIELWLEPGRALVSNTAMLVTSVINRAQRGENEWLYVDAGVFHGLIEAWDSIGFEFQICTEKEQDSKKRFVLAGPTCDSGDVIGRNLSLPDSLTLDDRLYILSAGAYTNSLEFYNGIPFPRVILAPADAAQLSTNYRPEEIEK